MSLSLKESCVKYERYCRRHADTPTFEEFNSKHFTNLPNDKEAFDDFWKKNNKAKEYFWMDNLFKKLLISDNIFKSKWQDTPFLHCEKIGSSHTFANYNFKMHKNNSEIKEILLVKPPYVLKFSSNWTKIFKKLRKREIYNSNAFYAIKMSKRKFIKF